MRPFARIAVIAALMCAAPSFAQTQPGAPPAEEAPTQGPVAAETPVDSPSVDTSTVLAATVTPPAIAADKANTWLLDLSSGGRVAIQLRPDFAPGHVARIQELTRQKFYDGLTFHRVIEGFMAQGGDPQGTGQGGSQLPDLKAEFNRLPHLRGTVAMARAESEDSANSQFYIVLMPTLKLDKKYTVFGRVTDGMQYVDAIERGEPPANPTRIVHAYLAADNPPPYANAPAPVAAPAPSIIDPAPAASPGATPAKE
ncbi:peptidylprolyl isomerase [Sphingomonas gilva]|uniref:Peptidyl-prolyl cis-trans isomerase n=1 Tax=Sphingomonas gilva TaxID=2305907 RepID=A0A396RWN0_9SPHN|nr:peptidylprolyl isomerase [Sphingomonas gilva]RHW18121.1 peptidylprolyl isomerase [Sphingomonas gilva]